MKEKKKERKKDRKIDRKEDKRVCEGGGVEGLEEKGLLSN